MQNRITLRVSPALRRGQEDHEATARTPSPEALGWTEPVTGKRCGTFEILQSAAAAPTRSLGIGYRDGLAGAPLRDRRSSA